MITNLPRQRDLWILLLVIILGAAAIVVLKTGVPGSGDVALGGGAEVSASLAPSAAPTEPAGNTGPAEAPSLESLPADTRAQFDALPAGTIPVACTEAYATYPEGIVPSIAPGWWLMHPGWTMILHGYCVDNPAIKPIDVPVMDVP